MLDLVHILVAITTRRPTQEEGGPRLQPGGAERYQERGPMDMIEDHLDPDMARNSVMGEGRVGWHRTADSWV